MTPERIIHPDHRSYDVVILGAGAAGLMCAITAGSRGKRVLVLERANRIGKKILMSGGGRCNFTNLYVEPGNYLSTNPHFCHYALRTYTQWNFISLIEQHGVAYEERNHGQLFCRDTAADVLNMLMSECESAGVETVTDACVLEVTRDGDGFCVELEASAENSRERIMAGSLVVATGALSIPTLGGSDFGYRLAEQFSLPLIARSAGLVPLTFSDQMKVICERLSGISVRASVSTEGDHPIFTEQLLFTHRGISGPAILQVSNYWQPGCELFVDLLPDIDAAEWIIDQKKGRSRALLRSVLAEKLPRALVLELQGLHWTAWQDRSLAEIPDRELKNIGMVLNRWVLKPSGTEGYRTAEVTRGGVDTDRLDAKTFAVRGEDNLYFIGEVLDVTGHLGGFNFQWAWSSGYCAGLAVR